MSFRDCGQFVEQAFDFWIKVAARSELRANIVAQLNLRFALPVDHDIAGFQVHAVKRLFVARESLHHDRPWIKVLNAVLRQRDDVRLFDTNGGQS